MTTISQRTLTTGEVAGSGVFDELMRTMKSHVVSELEAGRITEQSYSQVYLGALQSVLQTATQFALQVDTTNKQLELLDEQVKQAVTQNRILRIQEDEAAVSLELAQYNRDTMTPQQYALLVAQTGQIAIQNGLTTAQTEQSGAQKDLLVAQELLVDEQKADIEDKLLAEPVGGINAAAKGKTIAETNILAQKLLTEKAQTNGSFISDTVAAAAGGYDGTGGIGGLVGVEMHLKSTQRESFLRDAEQKAAKMYTDVFATLYATDPDDKYSQPENYGFDIGTARSVMGKLMEGIELTSGLKGDIGATGNDGQGVRMDSSISYPRSFSG